MTTTAQNHKDIVTLRDYMEARLDAVIATAKAAEETLNIRLESMNEFRDQISKERMEYLPRKEHEQIHAIMSEDIRMLREAKAVADGKASMGSVYISYLVAFIGIIFGIVNLVITVIQP